MKKIAITQRVDHIADYGEYRDCLDQNWTGFLLAINCFPLPLPTLEAKFINDYCSELKPDGIILSGGNSIACLDPKASDSCIARDNFENGLIEYALERNIPVIGVCRGMQVLNLFFGGSLSPVDNHIAKRHHLDINSEYNDFISNDVNSFHGWGIPKSGLSRELTPLASDKEGNIEAFRHTQHSIFGIMWHPERETPFSSTDINLFQSIF